MRVSNVESGATPAHVVIDRDPVRRFVEVLPRPLRFLGVGGLGRITDLAIFSCDLPARHRARPATAARAAGFAREGLYRRPTPSRAVAFEDDDTVGAVDLAVVGGNKRGQVAIGAQPFAPVHDAVVEENTAADAVVDENNIGLAVANFADQPLPLRLHIAGETL